MSVPSTGAATIIIRNAMLLLSVLLVLAVSGYAQGRAANTAPASCTNEIPIGVKVIRVPDAEQHKVTISDFSLTASKDAPTYDLSMRIKNGTDNWCITSLALTYALGDARGQEWIANEYPTVMKFKTRPDSAAPVTGHKLEPDVDSAPHSVGMASGQDEKRVVFDLYSYIQQRPTGYFDGFHLISAEIKYCMGYVITKAQ